jgi:predicted CxxxxCH...CXXCH cytochrome family protein
MDRNYLPGQTASHQFGSCNTLYCHSNGNPSGGSLVFAATPAWGQTTTCNSCHGAVPSTNNHTAHLNSIPSLTCEACHSGKGSGTTSHANGVKDVVISTLFDDGVTNPVTTATTAGCSNVSCHGKLTSPSWSAASAFDVYAADSSNCQMCHLLIGSTPAEKVAQSSYIEVYSGDNLSGADGSYYGYGAIFNLHMAHINEAAGLTQNGVIYCSDCHSSSRLQQQNFHFSQLVGGGKSLAKFAKGPAASTVGDAVGATDTMISSYSYGSSAPRGTCTPKPGFGCHTLGAVTRYWYK